MVEELLKEYLMPVFVADADTIILKDMLNFVESNKNYDLSLHIKEEQRYFQTIIAAGYSLFYPTDISFKFLDFNTKYILKQLKDKKLRWHIDQIALYMSYIYIQRKENPNIHNNTGNNHTNPEGFFYHTFHNKYLL